MIGWLNSEQSSCCLMPSVRASCCPLPLATPSGECVNHQSSVTLLFLDYKWGLFGIIKQICHASVGNMMECFPSGGWKHSIMLSPLAWHICILKHDRIIFRSIQGQIGKQCEPSELSKVNTFNSQNVLQTMGFNNFHWTWMWNIM